MNDELKPISDNNTNFDKELVVSEEIKKEEVVEKDEFASKFPDWDLLPTNQVVRRVTRK